LEKHRSRSGKIQKPTELVFGNIMKLYLDGANGLDQKKDIKFIPVTINYDRVHEGESFPLELLGEAKEKESLLKIARQFKHITKALGRVQIKYCEPISLHEYIASRKCAGGMESIAVKGPI
jgi:glycerol-3-phosphate O-acyltransferase